jgi:hypothetical protein
MAIIRCGCLLTEEDWMDVEFQAAAERYEGPPRSLRDPGRPVILNARDDVGILLPIEFDSFGEAGIDFSIGRDDALFP